MKRKKPITEGDVKAALDLGADMAREARSRRGRASRRKGQQSERDIAELVRRVFPDAKRGIGQARFGRECPDVDGTPYWIETKCGKSAPVRSALKQAIADTDGRVPVVIVKDDRCEPFVCMRLSDWLDDLWHDKRVLEAKAEAFHSVDEAKALARDKALRWFSENGKAVLDDIDANMPPDMNED